MSNDGDDEDGDDEDVLEPRRRPQLRIVGDDDEDILSDPPWKEALRTSWMVAGWTFVGVMRVVEVLWTIFFWASIAVIWVIGTFLAAVLADQRR